MPERNDEEQQAREDEVRLDAALQTIKDVAWRLEEISEGRRSIYDVVTYLIEDLVREGACPACLNEAAESAFRELGADTSNHQEGEDSVLH